MTMCLCLERGLPIPVETFRTLEKYKEKRKVDPEDEAILDRFSQIGWVGNHGINLEEVTPPLP